MRVVADIEGVNESSVRRRINSIKQRAAQQLHTPHDLTEGITPPGFAIKKRTIQVGPDGVERQWIREHADEEKLQELMAVAIESLKEDIKPAKPVEQLSTGPEDLLNCLVITDYHLGMQAWGEETRGDDWDLTIAEKLLRDWFTVTLERMPPAKTAVFAQLGDFLHWDGLLPVTPSSSHVLDADTRFQKLVRVAIRVLRDVTRQLLETHDHVHLIMAEGNHDMASSAWLREIFSAFYEGEPRITVDTSPDPYYAYQHGKTGLFFHHGHKRKTRDIDQVLARKFRKIYGETEHAYAHTGHYHHDKLEGTLMTVEQHRTLAAEDAYASRGGWMSGRDAKGITYHKEYGEVARSTVGPDMVRDLV